MTQLGEDAAHRRASPRYWSIDTIRGDRRAVDAAATSGMLRSSTRRLQDCAVDDHQDDGVHALAQEAFDRGADADGIRVQARSRCRTLYLAARAAKLKCMAMEVGP